MKRGPIIAGAAAALAVGVGALALPGAAPPGAPPAAMASAPEGTADGTAAGSTAVPALVPAAADAGRGASVFRACAACHTVGRGGADVDGPNLYGVVGSRVAGRRPRYGYTQALRDAGGSWTVERLNAWLTDPAAFAPGTAMHFAGLSDARDRADVVAYLEAQGPHRP